MLLLDRLAEQRIQEAELRGEFNDLPGAGQPLQLLPNFGPRIGY